MTQDRFDNVISSFVLKVVALCMAFIFTIMGGAITWLLWGSYSEMRGVRGDIYQLKTEFLEYKTNNKADHDTLKVILDEHLQYSEVMVDSMHMTNDTVKKLRIDVNANTKDLKEVKKTIGLF